MPRQDPQAYREYEKQYDKEYYQKHKREIDARHKQYRREHAEKFRSYDREYGRNYYKDHREKERMSNRTWRSTVEGRFSVLRQCAKNRGVAFSLSKEEFCAWFTATPHVCHYCHTPLIPGAPHMQILNALSIDRKDNSKGYTLDNVVLCCLRCNIVKNTFFTEAQMLRLGILISEFDHSQDVNLADDKHEAKTSL